MTQCLTPNCMKEARWRGVCWGCRERVRRSVARNQVTEEQLIKYGLLRQKVYPNGRKPSPSIYNDIEHLDELVAAPADFDISGHIEINPDGSFTFIGDEQTEKDQDNE